MEAEGTPIASEKLRMVPCHEAHVIDHARHGFGDCGAEHGRSGLNAGLLVQFGKLAERPGQHAFHALGREGVVGDDVLVPYLEAAQHQHREHPRAVLAGGTVEHRRECAGHAQGGQRLGQAVFALIEHRQVGALQVVGGIRGLLGALMSHVASMIGTWWKLTGWIAREGAAFVEFGNGAQVDDGVQAEPTDGLQVVTREAVQPVGANSVRQLVERPSTVG